jgi:hypothetical protein
MRREQGLSEMGPSFRPLPNETAALLFIMAKEAAKRSRQNSGTLGESLEVMTAVILCVVVAEAGMNEICQWFEFHRQRPPFSIPHGLPFEFDRLELRQKWMLLPFVARQRTFDRSAEPWQSFEALVELRNHVVHLKRRPLPKRVTGLLAAKLGAGDLSSDVAKWACATISDLFATLTTLVDPPQEWRGTLWLFQRDFPPGLSTPGWPEPN